MLKRFLSFVMITIFACSACLMGACKEKTGGGPASDGNASNVTSAPSETPTKDPAAVDYSLKTMDAVAVFENSKVQGRTRVLEFKSDKDVSEKGIALDYTASAVEFKVCCEGDITANFYANAFVIDNNRRPVLFINVYVDGVLQGTRDEYALRGSKEVTLAEGLSKGTHTVLIERQNEAEFGELYLTSVSFSGEFDGKPENSDLYIEVIGDSITTGYGNLYPDNTGGAKDPVQNPRSAYYQDGTRAYACLALKELGADYSIVAQQGIGASVGWQPHTMLETYEKTCYQLGRNEPWSFERQPDLVIINLGTNDISCGKATSDADIQKGFVDMIKTVREKNPNAKILWVYGAMDKSAAPIIEAAVKAAGGETAGIYCYTGFVSNGAGGIGHPVVSAHEENARLLAEKVKDILGL